MDKVERLPLSDGFANMLVKAGLGDLITYTSSPSYRYYRSKKDRFMFCWNTEALTPSEETKGRRWCAWIYRLRKTKKGEAYRMTKKVFFASRKAAKKRAFQWHKKRINALLKSAEIAKEKAFGGSQ